MPRTLRPAAIVGNDPAPLARRPGTSAADRHPLEAVGGPGASQTAPEWPLFRNIPLRHTLTATRTFQVLPGKPRRGPFPSRPPPRRGANASRIVVRLLRAALHGRDTGPDDANIDFRGASCARAGSYRFAHRAAAISWPRSGVPTYGDDPFSNSIPPLNRTSGSGCRRRAGRSK